MILKDTKKSSSPTWLLKYMKKHKDILEPALDACLPAGDVRTSKLVESMRYSLLAGGKRFRPLLSIASYQLFAPEGASLEPILPVAVAIELVHTMSLIVDDLPCLDDDDLRRGKATNHIVYGEHIAVLASHALVSYAFEYLGRNTSGVEPQQIVDVMRLLGRATGIQGLAGGQAMDVECTGKPNVSVENVRWMHTGKAGAMISASCASGAIIGGASKEDVARVAKFGERIGLAFQIVDDVLDITQSTEAIGKTSGKDELLNRATYPRLLGLQGSRDQAEKVVAEAKECLAPYGKRSETLLALADYAINWAK